MGQTTFSGPVRAGTVREGASANVGLVVLSQTFAFTFATVTTSTATGIILPAGFHIQDITVDVTTAWDSVTSDALEIGDITDADEFGDVADLQVLGRVVVDPDGPQAAVWLDAATTDTEIYMTVTSAGGSLTVGAAQLTVRYVQN